MVRFGKLGVPSGLQSVLKDSGKQKCGVSGGDMNGRVAERCMISYYHSLRINEMQVYWKRLCLRNARFRRMEACSLALLDSLRAEPGFYGKQLKVAIRMTTVQI